MMKPARAQAGFGLIELLVGILIGLVILLAVYILFTQGLGAVNRITSSEAAWHDAKIAMLAMSYNTQNSGYLMDLTRSGATSPVVIAPESSTYVAPGSFASEQISNSLNTSGSPLTSTPSTTVWDIYVNAANQPTLRQTVTKGGVSTSQDYAAGVVAMRFQLSCASSATQYYMTCPGGASDARSVQIALLIRTLSPDPSNKNTAVSAGSYTFPDSTVYSVPSTAGQGCVNGNCTLYRHQMLVTEVPLRNLNWGL